MPLDLARMREAQAVVARHVQPTPLVRAESLSSRDAEVLLKIETGLPTGSFKVRGALYSLTANLARRPLAEAIAASTGNHGAAVAWAGRLLGVKTTIFLPERPNPVKVARIRELGATLVERGRDLADAIDAAYEYAGRTGAFFLHDASDPDVPAGTATIGLELVEARPDLERVYAPMGDTGLIRGVAAAVKQLNPSATIVGVVAERAPAYLQSWQTRTVVETETAETIADGIAVRRALAPNVAAIVDLVDEVRAVSEDALVAAIAHLAEREGVIAEPAAAAATAAFLQDRSPARATALLVTGCNIAPDVLARARARAR